MNLVETPGHVKSHSAGSNGTIGAILVETGRLSADNAERVMRLQKTHGDRFGDAAIKLGLINEDDVRFALSSQFDYPYLAAADHSLSQELVAAYQPFSPIVEQLRALRSQLILHWLATAAERNTLVIVSPGKGEGRSFIAANLAIVFSQLGERTLLIDADLRTPRQHELFKLDRGAGLSDFLAGRTNAPAVVRITSLVGLSVLPSGAVPPNPQELIGRPAFTELLQSTRSSYDVVIVDTPAALVYADAQTIAARSGAALMLARKSQSSMADIAALSQRLQHSGAAIVGSVLNDG